MHTVGRLGRSLDKQHDAGGWYDPYLTNFQIVSSSRYCAPLSNFVVWMYLQSLRSRRLRPGVNPVVHHPATATILQSGIASAIMYPSPLAKFLYAAR